MENNINLTKECIDLLKNITEQQKIICNMYIKLYGENDDNTKFALRTLGKYTTTLHSYEKRCKGNETI